MQVHQESRQQLDDEDQELQYCTRNDKRQEMLGERTHRLTRFTHLCHEKLPWAQGPRL